MSKELTPLEAVKCLKEQFEICGIKNNPYLKIIETALKDYEMEHTLRIRLENINYELVEEKQENEKKLKALEIIKEKRVDITFFDTYIKWNWEKYQNRKLKCSEKELTKEEFDFLKEIM